MRPRTPLLSQYCTAIFIATSTATDPESEKNTRSSAGQQRSEPPRQRQRALVGEAAEHHVGHDVELALHRRARYAG